MSVFACMLFNYIGLLLGVDIVYDIIDIVKIKMEIVISNLRNLIKRSLMPELIIRKLFHLEKKGLRTLQNIKIKNEKNDMLIGIKKRKKNEDWTKSGVKTDGWMTKHSLWNRPTLQASVADINKTFKSLNVKMK